MHRERDESKRSGYRLVGDVRHREMKEKQGYITPVPGGVGPMTVAMLLKNTMKTYLAHIKEEASEDDEA
jgi:methylenetetrahydrofolate dehydrogenase (NADP+)/methenyltetrahydrofolate cyclohydrolase